MQVMSIRPVCPSFVLTLKTPPLVDPHVREDSTQKSLKPMVQESTSVVRRQVGEMSNLAKAIAGG